MKGGLVSDPAYFQYVLKKSTDCFVSKLGFVLGSAFLGAATFLGAGSFLGASTFLGAGAFLVVLNLGSPNFSPTLPNFLLLGVSL